jgi:hypothetical protein
MPKDAQTILDSFTRGISGASEKYRAGVTSPRRPWKDAAASEDAEKRYAAGVARAASQKTRQKAIASKTEADWKDAALNVGAAALAASAQRASSNYSKQLSTIIEAASAATNAAAQIPGDTMESRLQRGPAAARAVHRAWARKKGINPEV